MLRARSRRRPSAPKDSARARGARGERATRVLARLRETEPDEDVRWVEVFGHVGAAARDAAVVRRSCSAARWTTIRAPGSSPRRRSPWATTSPTSRASSASPRRATARWASPFDFAAQALLYVPQGLPPDPNDPAFTDAVVDAALPVLEASGGRAFLLFTTLRALRRAHELPARTGSSIRCWCRARARAASCWRAFARSATRCCSAASLLGRRRRARRGAVAGRDRQAAVRAARRSGARRAHRGDARARAAIRSATAAAAGGDAAQAGRRPADPRRDRPRRADAVRSAPAVASPTAGGSCRACRR